MSILENSQNRGIILVAFDFDGTLTTKDTLLEFVRFTHGLPRLILGVLRYSPLLLLMKMGLYSNGKLKELIFAYFYGGESYEQFVLWGKNFSHLAESMQNMPMIQRLQWHVSKGHTVCIVSASVDEWVRPICLKLGVDEVIATRVEVSSEGKLTGRFSTPNCYGAQKVERLLEVYPRCSISYLYAYGDSQGDKELLAFADEGVKICRTQT
jgi:HAD superfamily hydrolase (TIGR01490 family)